MTRPYPLIVCLLLACADQAPAPPGLYQPTELQPCLQDGECPQGYPCLAGACRPGCSDQLCDQIACSPITGRCGFYPGGGDQLEENDSPQTAAPLTVGARLDRLILSPGDEDWFRLPGEDERVLHLVGAVEAQVRLPFANAALEVLEGPGSLPLGGGELLLRLVANQEHRETTLIYGLALVEGPGACQGVPARGICEGNHLLACRHGEVVVQDCLDEICTGLGPDEEALCLPPQDPCGAVPLKGICQSDMALTCLEGGLSYSPCAELGMVCGADDEGLAACLPHPACQDLPPKGACVDGMARLCQGYSLYEDNCRDQAMACAIFDDGAPGCTASPFRLRGWASYVALLFGLSGNHPRTLPIDGALVELVSPDSQVLALTTTAADGSFELVSPGPYPPGSYVRLMALSEIRGRCLSVSNFEGAVHAFVSEELSGQNNDTVEIQVSVDQGSGAIHIFDRMRHGLEHVVDHLGVDLPCLEVHWEAGRIPPLGSSYYDRGELWILGGPEDPDEFDDSVLVHELGHFVEDNIGRYDSPGGPHGNRPITPCLAWSEGFATFFQAVVLGRTEYVDVNAGGAVRVDVETLEGDCAQAQPWGSLEQDLCEMMVAAVLLDLVDPAGEAGDEVEGVGHGGPVLDVVYHYSGGESFTLLDRGAPGMDLVDFLDGWLCRGQSSYPGLVTLLGALAFPYDFAGIPRCEWR